MRSSRIRLPVELRELGVKVALGDVSDDSHVQGSCTNCFTAVLITEAARWSRAILRHQRGTGAGGLGCGRSRFRRHPGDLGTRWSAPAGSSQEVGTVSPGHPDLVAEVAALDDARFLPQ